MWRDDLFKLSGMVFAQAKYSPYAWVQKTGVDPLVFPGYIGFTSEGLCIWTAKAERLYQQHKAESKSNWAALRIA